MDLDSIILTNNSNGLKAIKACISLELNPNYDLYRVKMLFLEYCITVPLRYLQETFALDIKLRTMAITCLVSKYWITLREKSLLLEKQLVLVLTTCRISL